MPKIPSRDRFFHKAKAEKYPARSVYKLEEIDRRFNIFRDAKRVLDLGASPGSWSQYAAGKLGAKGTVTAVDLKPPARELNKVSWLIGDVTELKPEQILNDGLPFDVVLSDMAPNTTGHKKVDAIRSTVLAEAAFNLAAGVLKPDGVVVVKVFMGEDFNDLIRQVKGIYKRTKTMKPEASLKQSRETYLLAWGLKGR